MIAGHEKDETPSDVEGCSFSRLSYRGLLSAAIDPETTPDRMALLLSEKRTFGPGGEKSNGWSK